jgi:hypothetical protein
VRASSTEAVAGAAEMSITPHRVAGSRWLAWRVIGSAPQVTLSTPCMTVTCGSQTNL